MSQQILERVASLSLAETLTHSELMCLRMIGDGHALNSIAHKLSMTTREVDMLLFCAERKLNAKNRMHAICIAASMGFLVH